MLQLLLSADPSTINKVNNLKQTPFDVLFDRIKQANPYEKNLEEVKEALYETLNVQDKKGPSNEGLISLADSNKVVGEIV
jgi:hypothetical protein